MSFFGRRLLPYPLPGPQPSEAGARRRTMAHREAVRRRKEIRIAPGGGRTLPWERDVFSTCQVQFPTPWSVTVVRKSRIREVHLLRRAPPHQGTVRTPKNFRAAPKLSRIKKRVSLRLTESTVSVQAVKSVYLNKQVQSRFAG